MLRHQSNYKILDLVGQGQFGRVFAAVQLDSGNLVALKELKTKQLSTSSFLRELTFLVTLDHFNLVTCRALEHGQNERYLVMDYCEGGTLRSLLNNSIPLTLHQSLKLVIDILSGLKFAHDRGIIHRDLKPENILLKTSDRFYTAHIADFGIAKLKQEADSQNILGNTGSPAYMAPEQFYGEYSSNCDLYGVGIILYELVTGDRPFSGMPKDLLTAHLSQPVKIPADMPMLLRLAIAKSLQKLPSRRYQTATEMLEALELVQAILEVDPSPHIPVPVKPVFLEVAPLSQSTLDYSVSQLAIASEQRYLVSGDRLIVQCATEEKILADREVDREIIFSEPIQNLQCSATGCLITTRSSIDYLTPELDLLNLATFDENNEITKVIELVTTINPQGTWVGVTYLTTDSPLPTLEIYQLSQNKLPRKLPRSLINQPACHSLIALDQKYGLGIYQNSAQDTEFRLFSRRGNWLANATIQIRLASAIDHPLFPHQLLATEVGNSTMVILITLDKFNLKRIPLGISPVVIAPCPQGYLISDRQGKMILLDDYGDCISRFQIPLSTDFVVKAIALDPSELLVISASDSSSSQLQRFSVSDLLSSN
ncbi:MAG: serine/threonine protein kinase [Waterburya sp.]